MKVIRFKLGSTVRYGVVDDEKVFAVEGSIFGKFSIGKRLCQLNEIKLLPPVQPKIVIGVGKNYRDSDRADDPIPVEPQLFFKPPSSVVGHGANIIRPSISKDIRCGGELAAVIKRRAAHVPEDRAMDYILGFTCANDVTAFDIAREDKFVTRCKSFYTFCPLGPCIKLGTDLQELKITSKLNGEVRQQGLADQMIFNIGKIISHATEFMLLKPGDVILTGTVGTSFAVNVRDMVEVQIDEIGVLRNKIVQE